MTMAGQDTPCPIQGRDKLLPKRVSLFLNINNGKYSLNQSLVLDVGIRNDGRDDVYIYKWLVWGYADSLVLTLRDQSGEEIEPLLHDDTLLPPPPRKDDASMFVQLMQDDFYGTRRSLPITDLVKTPGKYTLQIQYRGPLSCKYVDPKLRELPALWRENATISSNVVSFEITP